MTTIFISIPWFHPAFRAGGPVQSVANLVNEFNGEFEFYIFCGNTDLNNVALPEIETGKWVKYNGHTKVWYAAPSNRRSTLVSEVKKIDPAVIFVIGIYSWQFNIVPLLFCKAGRKIISVRGMLHPGALTQKGFKKKLYIAVFKMLGLQHKTSFQATDDAEKKYIEAIMGREAKVFVAGNFPRVFLPGAGIEKRKNSLRLVSIALISPMKNHLLVLQALEQCSADIVYDICGPVKDMPYWQECRQQIKRLPVNIRVHYHGDVQPQEVEGYVQRGQVFIVPSKSENFGHAFYEALSAGKPVITSHFTPWQNLRSMFAGENINNELVEIKNAIDFFAGMGQEEYDRWSKGAVEYARQAVDIAGLKKQYLKMFNITSGKQL